MKHITSALQNLNPDDIECQPQTFGTVRNDVTIKQDPERPTSKFLYVLIAGIAICIIFIVGLFAYHKHKQSKAKAKVELPKQARPEQKCQSDELKIIQEKIDKSMKEQEAKKMINKAAEMTNQLEREDLEQVEELDEQGDSEDLNDSNDSKDSKDSDDSDEQGYDGDLKSDANVIEI